MIEDELDRLVANRYLRESERNQTTFELRFFSYREKKIRREKTRSDDINNPVVSSTLSLECLGSCFPMNLYACVCVFMRDEVYYPISNSFLTIL